MLLGGQETNGVVDGVEYLVLLDYREGVGVTEDRHHRI